MAQHLIIQTTFEPSRVIQPIYTGGAVSLSRDGRILASTLGEEALLTDLHTGRHLARIEGDGEPITTLALTPDGRYLTVCSRSLAMRIFAIEQAEGDDALETKQVRALKPHSAPVVVVATDASSSLLATGGADGVVKVWDLRGGFVSHTFHGHSGVVSALHFFQVQGDEKEQPSKRKKRKSQQQIIAGEDSRGDLTIGFRLASGAEDGKIKIWDLHKRKSIAALDSHVSVVRSLAYSSELGLLLSASRDKTVIIWDAETWRPASTVPILESVESAGFLENGRFFFTGGETARLRVWTTANGKELMQEQPAGSETEAIIDVQSCLDWPYLLSVHADQTLVLHSLEPLTVIPTAFHGQIPPLPVLRTISGTHDEVIDLAFVGSERKHMALATNLEDIRIISIDETQAGAEANYFGADVGLLRGHEDIVITLSMDWSGHWLATGAKDNTAKLWRLDPVNKSFECYTTFTGHAESIGAVALPSATPPAGSSEYNNPLSRAPRYLVTGSQDKTIKRWDIPNSTSMPSRATYTRKAHDKDINAIATSYASTSTMFASASQDRTVKIWDLDSGEAMGVLRGHKRGVWSVAFAPLDMPALTTNTTGGGASSAKGMVVTGSGDKTVRIWSLNDYSCLRTFEGHANSVLKVVWLPPSEHESGRGKRGVLVASAAGDGLVKLWDAQESECATTLDNHVDRVWALAVQPRPTTDVQDLKKVVAGSAEDTDMDGKERTLLQPLTLVSGSADSTLTFWTDTTEKTALQATTKATARIEQDQELQNHIRASNYREAIVLALQLNHPRRLLDLFTTVVQGPQEEGSYTGNRNVEVVLASLSDSQLWSLLRRIRDWNANGRTHAVAQRVLYAILRLHPKERLLNLRRRRQASSNGIMDEELSAAVKELTVQDKTKESVKEVLDGLKAYTERHYGRLEKQADERFVLAWALEQMDAVGGGDINGLANGHADEDVLMLENGA